MCQKCGDKGYVPLPSEGRMVRHGPCDCEAGKRWAEAVATFANENPPDRILGPLPVKWE